MAEQQLRDGQILSFAHEDQTVVQATDRQYNLEHGKAALEREFKRLNLTSVDLDVLLESFNVRSIEDLYVGIGFGDITMGRVINKVSNCRKVVPKKLVDSTGFTKPAPGSSVMVNGFKGTGNYAGALPATQCQVTKLLVTFPADAE